MVAFYVGPYLANVDDTYTSDEYLRDNPTWHVEDSPWKARHIVKMLDRNEVSPRSIAEVGCGVGEILNQLYILLPDEVEFHGYEISPHAYKACLERQKKRLDFHLADLTELDVTFDLLLVIDVFEHVEDYLGFLRKLLSKANSFMFHIPLDLSAQTVLRDGSLLKTRREVGHLHYFTEKTALATLRDTGYEVEDYFFTARGAELAGGGCDDR